MKKVNPRRNYDNIQRFTYKDHAFNGWRVLIQRRWHQFLIYHSCINSTVTAALYAAIKDRDWIIPILNNKKNWTKSGTLYPSLIKLIKSRGFSITRKEAKSKRSCSR